MAIRTAELNESMCPRCGFELDIPPPTLSALGRTAMADGFDSPVKGSLKTSVVVTNPAYKVDYGSARRFRIGKLGIKSGNKIVARHKPFRTEHSTSD